MSRSRSRTPARSRCCRTPRRRDKGADVKLILTTDVGGLGAPGDIVEVKDGYGRNYLLPRGLAIMATKGAEKQVQTIRRAQQTRTVRDLDHANEIKDALARLGRVRLTARA